MINSATDAASGTYYVTVTDINGCSSVASTVATVTTKITLNTVDQTICSGTTTTIASFALGGTPPYTYYWDGFPLQSHVVVTPMSSISYQAQAIDTLGCKSNISTLHITVIPPVKINSIPTRDTICPGESVVININPFQGNGGPYSYYLADGTIIPNPYTAYPDGIHEFIIFAQDSCGAVDSDTIRIHVYEIPPMSYAPDKTFGCVPVEVYFNETSSDIGQKYVWNFGDDSYNSTSYIQNPTHVYRGAGTYDVNLTITSSNGCESVYRYPALITAYPLPGSEFTSDKGGAKIINSSIIFKNLTKDINCLNYWTFGDGDSSDARNPIHRYDTVGVFPVRLISVTLEGCTDTATKNIVILDEFTFFAPTAFTPDNDNTNDKFYVRGNGIDPNTFTLIIFDRWGEKIYETHQYDLNDPEKYGWDGKVKGKIPAENGVYSWIAIYKDNQKVEHQQTGLVTVIK
jgi:gliding motility-associated-like protein